MHNNYSSSLTKQSIKLLTVLVTKGNEGDTNDRNIKDA